MKSYEAIAKAVNGNTVEHAKKLHKSTPLLNKWMEPSTDYTDSGAYNPIDRIETIIETALTLGTPQENATAPIQYLAERFNIITISIPKHQGAIADLSNELLKTISEFGDLTRVTSKAMRDGIIKIKEAKEIEKKHWELIRQLAVFNRAVMSACKGKGEKA